MIYLLAKYTLLYLLASGLGFLLGYWWSRRNLVDVSESWEDLRAAAARDDSKQWSRLWDRLDALPEPRDTDLSGIFERLDKVSTSIAAFPQPEKTDLGGVETKLAVLEKAVRDIPAPKEPDLEAVNAELASIRNQLAALPVVETHEPVDLGPVSRRIESLEQKVSRVAQPKLDLVPVEKKIDSLEQKVTRLPRPEKVDIKPISDKLRNIETEIVRLDKRLGRPASTPARARQQTRPQQRRSEPKILSAALYGKKDDLKMISGVGPKLERLLNKNGVFYFWQVASWSNSDINIIDERLDAFKGRISRDNWVRQAKDLKKLPDAAAMPANA